MATIESTTEIRPFSVEVPEEDLVDLRRRIAATRWPERETVADESQGVRRDRRPRHPLLQRGRRRQFFAARQEPELFTTELRAPFRSLRDERRSS